MKFSRKTVYFFLALGITFLFFAFFRFFNLDKRIIFDWDQEQFTTQIRDIIANHKYTLLGPRVVGPEGFFLAPYLTYLLTPIFLLTKLHPIALKYFIYIVDVVFFASGFMIIKKLFNQMYALFFLVFWSMLHVLIAYDTIPWWPVLIPLGTLTTWYLLYRIYRNNSAFNFILLGINLGFFMNMHFQFIFIVLFAAIFLLYGFLVEKKITGWKILITFAAFAVMFTPLLMFDVRHDFLNVKLFLQFFLPKGAHSTDTKVWWTVFSFVLQPFVYIKSVELSVIIYLATVVSALKLFKMKKNYSKGFYFATSAVLLAVPLFFSFYGKRPSEYYFVFLYPFFILMLIDNCISFKKPVTLGAILVFLFVTNVPQMGSYLNTNYYGLYYKDQLVKKIKTLGEGKKFNISFEVWPNGDTGIRYLIDYYKIRQSGDPVDQLIRIRTTPEKGDVIVGGYGAHIPENLPSY